MFHFQDYLKRCENLIMLPRFYQFLAALLWSILMDFFPIYFVSYASDVGEISSTKTSEPFEMELGTIYYLFCFIYLFFGLFFFFGF